MTKVFHLFGALCLLPAFVLASDADFYLFEAQAQKGDGILSLLRRYQLEGHSCNVKAFYELNKLKSTDHLKSGTSYTLPVKIFQYNGISIRSTLKMEDYDLALRIAKYNLELKDKGIRRTRYMDSKILWVPFHLLGCEDTPSLASAKSQPNTSKEAKEYLIEPLLGKDHQRVRILDKSLQGKVFYIISGHGGPDPGASGTREGHSLVEDEYAYDVALRLYRKLLSHGAKAYMIIQDADDGIREDKYLDYDQDEKCLGKAAIPLNQRIRLDQRSQAVNHLYKQNKKKGLTDQTMISIHVDSRNKNKRQDVFFYYCEESKSGKKLAENMLKTFEDKYKENRRSGSYSGTISPRNLYVLKNTAPKAVFVELANIRNEHDQKRVILNSNREALAEWLYLGLIK